MPTIGLSMIVKDEAHVVARCLGSLRGFVDRAVIVDTGSTDGTQHAVRDSLALCGIAGEVIEEPWRDFAHNRTSALAAMRERTEVDYVLVMDADDLLAFDAGFDVASFKAGLSADVYDIVVRHGPTVYSRPQIFSNRLALRYRSVLHEYLEIPASATRDSIARGFHIAFGGDGQRSRDPRKFIKDAALLERALDDETDPSLRARYTFYLAQSYRDGGQRRPAIDAYLRRAELGHWDQEVFESLLNAGVLMAADGEPTESVLEVLGRATAVVPTRAEAVHAAARVCRERGENRRGVEAAKPGLGLPQPTSGLFLQPWIYDTGLLDEHAVNAYRAGHDMDCLVACSIILSRPGLDDGTRNRVASNRAVAYERMAARGSPWVETLADQAPRIAVVTPYYKEAPELIWRCIDSVKRQTIPTDHILVADGHPQDWLDGAVTRHVRLDRPSADYGNTPRTVGGLLAASAGYTAICLLDADCWYDDDHVERCLGAALAVGMEGCRTITASRRFCRPDLSVMPLADEDPDDFIDTNCHFFLPPSFGLLASWSLVPKTLDWIADRVFFLVALAGGHLSGRTRRQTVNYVTVYEAAYRALGEAPPMGAKGLPDHARYRAWIDALPAEAVETIRRQIGIDIRGIYHPEYRTRPPAAASDHDTTGVVCSA